jgi:hypothetical protein
MTSWSQMRPQEFDPAGLTKKQRDIVATSRDTLFPDLIPAPAPRPVPEPEPQIDGQLDIFGGVA